MKNSEQKIREPEELATEAYNLLNANLIVESKNGKNQKIIHNARHENRNGNGQSQEITSEADEINDITKEIEKLNERIHKNERLIILANNKKTDNGNLEANLGDDIERAKSETRLKLDELMRILKYHERSSKAAMFEPIAMRELKGTIIQAGILSNTFGSILQLSQLKPLHEVKNLVQKHLENEASKEKNTHRYELNFGYLYQPLRKLARVSGDEKGAVFVSLNELLQLSLLLPIGGNGVEKLQELAEQLIHITGQDIFIKKVTSEQKYKLLDADPRFKEYNNYPYDEDLYPQVIAQLSNMKFDEKNLKLELIDKGWAKIRQKINTFDRDIGLKNIEFERLSSSNKPEVKKLIENWAEKKLKREMDKKKKNPQSNHTQQWLKWDLVEPYTTFLNDSFLDEAEENKIETMVMYKKSSGNKLREPMGVAVAGIINNDTAALYGNISHPLHEGSSQLLITELFRLLKYNKQVSYVNMGGSEEYSLYEPFKRRFNPLEKDQEIKLHCLKFTNNV